MLSAGAEPAIVTQEANINERFGPRLDIHPALQTEWLLRIALPSLLAHIGRSDEAALLRRASLASEPGRVVRGEVVFLQRLVVELQDDWVARIQALPTDIRKVFRVRERASDESARFGLIYQVGPVVRRHLRPSSMGMYAYRAASCASDIAHADPAWPNLPRIAALKADLAEELLVQEPCGLAGYDLVRIV